MWLSASSLQPSSSSACWRSPPPVRELWKRDCERKRRAFSTRCSHCRSTRFSVKGARGTTDLRQTFAEEITMRRIVQPARCAAWMRQRNERHAIDHARAADGILERDLPPEPVDREAAEKKDHTRLEKRELLIEPGSAERDLRRRRPAIAAARRRLPRKAFRDRGAIGQMLLVDAGLCEPAPELRAGTAAERLTRGQLDRTRCLPDDRDAVPNGSGDDRAGALEEAPVDALRARAD